MVTYNDVIMLLAPLYQTSIIFGDDADDIITNKVIGITSGSTIVYSICEDVSREIIEI